MADPRTCTFLKAGDRKSQRDKEWKKKKTQNVGKSSKLPNNPDDTVVLRGGGEYHRSLSKLLHGKSQNIFLSSVSFQSFEKLVRDVVYRK
jgi:hypothetical protein